MLNFLFNAFKKHLILENEIQYQPYEKGDLLVFKSSELKINRIRVTEVNTVIADDDPLAFFPKKIQILFVLSTNTFLKIEGDRNDGATLYLSLRLGNKRTPTHSIQLKELIESKPFSKVDKNIVRIPAKESYNSFHGDFDLAAIYWDLKFGYHKIEYKDGSFWELTLFQRGDEILFKKE